MQKRKFNLYAGLFIFSSVLVGLYFYYVWPHIHKELFFAFSLPTKIIVITTNIVAILFCLKFKWYWYGPLGILNGLVMLSYLLLKANMYDFILTLALFAGYIINLVYATVRYQPQNKF